MKRLILVSGKTHGFSLAQWPDDASSVDAAVRGMREELQVDVTKETEGLVPAWEVKEALGERWLRQKRSFVKPKATDALFLCLGQMRCIPRRKISATWPVWEWTGGKDNKWPCFEVSTCLGRFRETQCFYILGPWTCFRGSLLFKEGLVWETGPT